MADRGLAPATRAGLRPGGARLPGVPGIDAGSPAWTPPTAAACWRSWSPCWTGGRSLVVVLGGVELPPVPGIHRPCRPGRGGEPGRGAGVPTRSCRCSVMTTSGWSSPRARRGRCSARDAAITLLALTTGLRACDIIALRLADIDWRGQMISIVQQKTGNPLTLPLTGAGDGQARRLCAGRAARLGRRPRVPAPVAPHVRLADHASIHRVTAEMFRAAGVTDMKAGTRFLRHNAASRMLRAAAPLPTISAVLGHASEESTRRT